MRRKMDNIDVILGVMEDAESIYDISKIQNGRLNQKWPYFNSWWADYNEVSVNLKVLEDAESIELYR